MSSRQEVLNVLLAQLLQERGLVAAPEQIQNFGLGTRRMPDVLVDFHGLRLAIEGEFAPYPSGNLAQAERKAAYSALKRVEQGIAHIGIALIYPDALRSVPFERLKEELARVSLRFAIVTESCQQQLSLPTIEKEPVQFTEGSLDTLAEALRRAYEQLIHDEVLEHAIALIEKGIERFVAALRVQPAATERFKSVLEVKELPEEELEDEEVGEEEAYE